MHSTVNTKGNIKKMDVATVIPTDLRLCILKLEQQYLDNHVGLSSQKLV